MADSVENRPVPLAFVTGGTRGIGRAIARAIIEAGGRTVIAGRDASGVRKAVQSLGDETARHDAIHGVVADVRERPAVDAAVGEAATWLGGLNVLVNNAGVGLSANVAETSDEDWHRVFDTNVNGPFYCTRAAIPHLKAAGGGWIINIASLAGGNPFAGGGAYCATKAALIAFTESLMQEVRYDNIRATVILPGSVATEFSRSASGDTSWKLTGDDVAAVVVDLLRHQSRSLPSRVEIRPSKPRKN